MSVEHVIINGRFLGRAVTGVERYAREVVRAIDALVEEQHELVEGVEFAIAYPEKFKAPAPYKHIPLKPVGRTTGHLWEQVELPLYARHRMILNLCNFSPILHRRSVTCIHDAHVWLIPENFSAAFKAFYRALLPVVAARSYKWVTISEYSYQQLKRLGAVRRAPAALIGNGSDHALRFNAAKAQIKRTDLPERYVLALGSNSPNKNFSLIERIAPALAERGLSVVVAGGSNSAVFGASDTRANGKTALHRVGRVSDDDLALLYKDAVCFLFPSYFEGFGVPPIEAMALGTPVIASNSSALPEVLGDAAILCSPENSEEWIAAVDSLLTEDERWQRQVCLGAERASRHTWRAAAIAYLEIIRSGRAQ